MTNKFLTRLSACKSKGPILFDGATGTLLYTKGVAPNQCFDELNLINPAIVAEVHRDYINAGAEIIETNTFGANRFKLAEHSLQDKVTEINITAVQLARRVVDASFKDILIAGAVGPLGGYLAPLGRLKPKDAFNAFKEQLQALVSAGVDLIIFETFSDLLELEQAVAAMRAVDPTTPIITQVTFTNDGRTPLGDMPAEAAEKLITLNADVVGVNCSVGPARVLRSLKAMSAHLPPNTVLSAQPNAGWPERTSGRLLYPATPQYFAEYAAAFTQLGVSIIGGCCGTTPTHIAEMRQALDNPPTTKSIYLESRPIVAESDITEDMLDPTNLAQKLAGGEFVSTVEIHPPRGFSVSKVMAAAQMLQEAGATVVNIADTPVARMRMSPWAVCHLIQTQIGLETVLNFPTRGRNLLRIQGDLLAAHALNLRNLFVVMGDPTTIGDYPQAFNHYDVVSSGLIHLVKHQFNAGLDYAGKKIAQPTNFLVGCALNLNAANPNKEVKLLKKKIDNGADFAMTQPIYDITMLDTFLKNYQAEYGPLKLPLIISLLPLYNAKHAEFLHNEVPGIIIPQTIRDHIRQANGQAQSTQIGIKMAQEFLLTIKEKAQGVYIMPPFKRYNLAAEILEVLQ